MNLGDAMNFQEFELSQPINDAIIQMGFTSATEVQEKVIPILRTHQGDFVGQAQTGTGKTAAFVIPLLEQINFKSKKIQALILAPTRELANQVYEEIKKLGKFLPLKATTVYGGVPYVKQINEITRDNPQIIVGTPGRIIDLINRKVLNLSQCHQLIIDEADEMLNMGFIDDVQTIISSLNQTKKMWMFSATMPDPIVKLIEKKFSKPKIVQLEKRISGNRNIKQYYFVAHRRHFGSALKCFIDANPDSKGIVFCETRQDTKQLAELMQRRGVSVAALHGELSQSQRDDSMKKFKDKRVDFLICTDVAARGIDVPNISHVFNMGLPKQYESYVHRIGRTGRAELKGTSISFVAPDQIRKRSAIEHFTGQKMEEINLPDANTLKKLKIIKELHKMENIKNAILSKEDSFALDPSFVYFQSYFSDLTKEQALKLLFTYRFNQEIRHIDESVFVDAPPKESSKRSPERDGYRSRDRNRNRSRNKDQRKR